MSLKRLFANIRYPFALFISGFIIMAATSHSAHACGGLFCSNSPVDQNAERIIFTDNGNGTISALIQIQYTGFADDFSWILPMPEAIPAEAVEVLDTATTAFNELEQATNPVFIAPPLPNCAQSNRLLFGQPDMIVETTSVEADSEVIIFASGEAGPFSFDVIGSQDPDALIIWLRENNYRVTEEMEPLINVYVEEQFVFLAMRLLPNEGVQDIQPVQVTYESEKFMIPLRLTAVAANPDMAVQTWFFAEQQVIPENFAHMEIGDEEIIFFDNRFNHNYRQLLSQRANEFDGQAFITEFAGPSDTFQFNDPLLQALQQRHRYLTRLNTVISPEEMTLDPIFTQAANRLDVSNVHDLSDRFGVYQCERDTLTYQVRTAFSNEEAATGSLPAGSRDLASRAIPTNALLIFIGLSVVTIGLILKRKNHEVENEN